MALIAKESVKLQWLSTLHGTAEVLGDRISEPPSLAVAAERIKNKVDGLTPYSGWLTGLEGGWD